MVRGVLDDVDKKIIEILQKDGKVPLREISKITRLPINLSKYHRTLIEYIIVDIWR